jgi:hypothetical protein
MLSPSRISTASRPEHVRTGGQGRLQPMLWVLRTSRRHDDELRGLRRSGLDGRRLDRPFVLTQVGRRYYKRCGAAFSESTFTSRFIPLLHIPRSLFSPSVYPTRHHDRPHLFPYLPRSCARHHGNSLPHRRHYGGLHEEDVRQHEHRPAATCRRAARRCLGYEADVWQPQHCSAAARRWSSLQRHERHRPGYRRALDPQCCLFPTLGGVQRLVGVRRERPSRSVLAQWLQYLVSVTADNI